MPTYDFECQECGHQFTHLCKMSERGELLDCPSEAVDKHGKPLCGAVLSCRQVVGLGGQTVHFGTERKRGDSRLIYSEKQVSSELGARWRDAGTTGRPGGAGKKTHFHR